MYVHLFVKKGFQIVSHLLVVVIWSFNFYFIQTKQYLLIKLHLWFGKALFKQIHANILTIPNEKWIDERKMHIAL